MAVRPEQIDAIDRQLEGNITHLSILTREQFDELMMCQAPGTQTNHSMSPLANIASPATTPNNHVNVREMAYDYFWQPVVTGNTWSVPTFFGAKDFYKDVWHKSQQMYGLAGTRIREIFHNGRHYVAIEGERAQRALLQRSNYFHGSHAEIIDIGFGQQGLASKAVAGIRSAIWVGVGIEVIDPFFNDEATLATVLGGIVAEVDKAAIASAIAYVISSAIGVFAGTVAFVPVATFIIVGIAAGVALNALDNHFGLKKGLQVAIAEFFDQTNNQIQLMGEWSKDQVDELGHAIDKAVNSYRQSLDVSIDSADRHFEEVINRAIEHPSLASPEEIQSAAMQGSLLKFQRWVLGD